MARMLEGRLSEKSMSHTVMGALVSLHATRIENYCSAGTPDIEYIQGWLELKEMPGWPIDPQWHLRIPHFTIEQRLFLRKRCYYGGNAHLLLKVGAEWLLIRGDKACDIIGSSTADELRAASELVWKSRDRGCWEKLLEHLKKGRTT